MSSSGGKHHSFFIVRELILNSADKFDYVTESDQNYLTRYLYFTSLIHPTPIDLSYSARVIYNNKTKTHNDLEIVLPNTDLGNGSQFIVGPNECYRNYLKPDELLKSYFLYEKYNKVKDAFPKKINVAINYYLSNFWNFYFEISISLIVIALEMLYFPKYTKGSTDKFKKLIPIISKELFDLGYITRQIHEDEAETIYKLRCKYIHKREFHKSRDEFEKEYLEYYPYLESAREILSGIIRRSIEDPDYLNNFKNPPDINKILSL